MADRDRWAVGLDPQTVTYDDRIVALTTAPRHASYLVACVNAWERQQESILAMPLPLPLPLPTGVRVVTGGQLDAERRGQPLRHPAEVFHKRGVRCELGDDCALFDDEKG